MDKLNKYQKIQIILLALIIIAFITFIMSIVKNKTLKNYTSEQTFSESTDIVEETENDGMLVDEEGMEIQDEDTSWDDEDAEDTKVDPENEESKDYYLPYYIKINYTANCITVYKKDNSGNYTVPVKAIICSTGKATPTSGVYKMSQKYRWHQLNGGVYGQYCSRITGHILFHSVPYSKASPDSLKYVAYDKLGTKASAGCIRLTTADAIWIYNNCPSGTYVEFYSSSNPGPLGKPSAQKISSNVQCRNWDPTDPDSKNPWRTYKPQAETQKKDITPTVSNPVNSSQPNNENIGTGSQPQTNGNIDSGNQNQPPKDEEKQSEQDNNPPEKEPQDDPEKTPDQEQNPEEQENHDSQNETNNNT